MRPPGSLVLTLLLLLLPSPAAQGEGAGVGEQRGRRGLLGDTFYIAFILDTPNTPILQDHILKYFSNYTTCQLHDYPCLEGDDPSRIPRASIKHINIKPADSVTNMILQICNQINGRPLVGVIVSSPNQYVHLSLASVAYHFGIPIVDITPDSQVGYYTSDSYVYVNMAVRTGDDARAIAALCDTLAMRNVVVISPEAYGFLVQMKREFTAISRRYYDAGLIEKDMTVGNITWIANDTSGEMCREMQRAKQTVFILHGDKTLARDLFETCATYITRVKPALIVTQDIITEDPEYLKSYPDGLIAIRENLQPNSRRQLTNAIELLINATMYLQKIKYNNPKYEAVNFERDLQISERTQPIPKFRREVFVEAFRTCLVGLPLNESRCVRNVNGLFEIVNLYLTPDGRREWHRKGAINQYQHVTLESLTWVGNTYQPPLFTDSVKSHLTVAIAAIEPFLILKQPGADRKCYIGTECYPLTQPEEDILSRVEKIKIPKHSNPILNASMFENIRQCCVGLEVELLQSLSKDMNFEYTLYFGNFPAGVRTQTNEWIGLVGAVIEQQVDLAIGSISITQERAKVVRFTTPYFYSGYAILVAKKPPEPENFAFLQPLSGSVWLAIFISMNIIAIVKACCEWYSPYGLNPSTLGDNAKGIFAFPSALTSVYSLLFLHTHPCKLPRSLSARLLTYLWAGIAVLVVSSYTANLASFMTGRLTHLDLDILKLTSETAIQRSTTSNLRYGAERGSSAQKYITEQWPHMRRTMEHNLVPSAQDAITKLKNGTLDAYFDDAPIIFWQVASDADCKLLTVGSTFGDDYYGIAVGKENSRSRTYEEINHWLHNYRDNFYLDKLREKWFTDHHQQLQLFKEACIAEHIEHSSLGFEHVSGLFYMLGLTIFGCVTILACEHLFYGYFLKHFISKQRKKPPGSGSGSDKSIPKLLFISQQIHNSVREASTRDSHQPNPYHQQQPLHPRCSACGCHGGPSAAAAPTKTTNHIPQSLPPPRPPRSCSFRTLPGGPPICPNGALVVDTSGRMSSLSMDNVSSAASPQPRQMRSGINVSSSDHTELHRNSRNPAFPFAPRSRSESLGQIPEAASSVGDGKADCDDVNEPLMTCL